MVKRLFPNVVATISLFFRFRDVVPNKEVTIYSIKRFQNIMAEVSAVPFGDTSSQYDRNYEYWRPGESIQVGKVVGWIFLFEEEGIRMKE